MAKITHKLTIAIAAIFFLFPIFAYAQNAALLPNAEQQFFDANGNPLSAGTVTTYIVGTTTLKTTWTNSTESIPNTNPIILDAAGRAIIYGDGAYRQVVKDRNGNIIWDAITSAVGTGSATLYGDGTAVGTILPWSGLVVPTHYAFAYGQELSRTTYVSLYAAITLNTNLTCTSGSNILGSISDTTQIPIGAPVEVSCVAAGTVVTAKSSSTVTVSNNSSISLGTQGRFFPWGNGNGTTTFNVPDLRGKVLPGRDNMGGVVASNLTSTYYGVNPDAIGASGGSQSKALATTNLPAYTPVGTITLNGHDHYVANADASTVTALDGTNAMTVTRNLSSDFSYGLGGSGTAATLGHTNTTTVTGTFAGTAQGGVATAFSVIQPSITTNYIVKITPDTTISTLNVVTSIGGMTGDIICGAGTTCAGQTISLSGAGMGNSVLNFSNTGGAAVCTGVDAIDDSVAINAAITYVVAIGGGTVYFPNGTDCRLKNPINAAGVTLLGQGGVIPNPAATSVIRPSVNMTALILQADLATPLGNFGIVGMSLDGRKGDGITVTDLIRVSAFGSQIQDSWIANGSGNCVRWDGNASFAWINKIIGNSIGGCDGYGMLWSGTDSWISNNEFGGNGLANVKTVSAGANTFSINKFETSTTGVGLIIHTPDTGDSNCMIGNNLVASVYTSNIFEMNGSGIKYEKGTCAGSVKISDINVGNVFIQSTTCDVNIASGIINGHLGPNNHNDSGAATAYVCFAPAGTNTGWKFDGVAGAATLVSNAPTDLEYDIHGDQEVFKRTTGTFSGALTADHFVASTATQGFQFGSWTMYESAGTAILYNGTNRFFVSAVGGTTSATAIFGAGSAITSSGPGGAMTALAFAAPSASGITGVGTITSGIWNAGAVTSSSTIKTAGFAIGSLPAGTVGMRAYVTDQITSCPANGAALTNGGALVCPVFYNGSAWVGG